jgi:NADPH:quinone reductase-like Zn-dependent oxidoreductase
MARRVHRWDSGCSASQTGIATAPWPVFEIEARNLAPLPGDVDFTVGASLPISGLTAWQGLSYIIATGRGCSMAVNAGRNLSTDFARESV